MTKNVLLILALAFNLSGCGQPSWESRVKRCIESGGTPVKSAARSDLIVCIDKSAIKDLK